MLQMTPQQVEPLPHTQTPSTYVSCINMHTHRDGLSEGCFSYKGCSFATFLRLVDFRSATSRMILEAAWCGFTALGKWVDSSSLGCDKKRISWPEVGRGSLCRAEDERGRASMGAAEGNASTSPLACLLLESHLLGNTGMSSVTRVNENGTGCTGLGPRGALSSGRACLSTPAAPRSLNSNPRSPSSFLGVRIGDWSMGRAVLGCAGVQ